MNASSDKEDRLTRELLDAVDQRADISQRHLAQNMGVALGLTNSYLKRCIRKGLIKIKTAPANRYLYYLTPKGFAEKSRLTREYLSHSFSFYRKAADSCHRLFLENSDIPKNGTVAFIGMSDLAEIASIRALENKLELLGTYDPSGDVEQFLGKPVWNDLAKMPEANIYILTELDNTEAIFEKVSKLIGEKNIQIPDILLSAVTKSPEY